MSALTRFLFPVPAQQRTAGSLFRWWESRRLAYNAIVGASGLFTLGVIKVVTLLPPSSHDVRIFWPAIVVFGVLANICYSLGFLAEAAMQRVWKDETPPVAPYLFRQGLVFSVGLTLLPIVIAGIDWGFRILRWIIP